MNELNKIKKQYILQYLEQCNESELDELFKKCVGINDNIVAYPVYPSYPVHPTWQPFTMCRSGTVDLAEKETKDYSKEILDSFYD